MNTPTSIYDFSVTTIEGSPLNLASLKGKVLLMVNTASRCGFTSQYKALETLQKELGPRGFSVLGFPCNQFGGQEPGSEQEIKDFCELNYAVSFPLFKKIDVNGEQADPLYVYLKKAAPGVLGTEAIKWNFTKFLVDREGKVRERFAPTSDPLSIRGRIEALL
jgi:glutathione peroxidase